MSRYLGLGPSFRASCVGNGLCAETSEVSNPRTMAVGQILGIWVNPGSQYRMGSSNLQFCGRVPYTEVRWTFAAKEPRAEVELKECQGSPAAKKQQKTAKFFC